MSGDKVQVQEYDTEMLDKFLELEPQIRTANLHYDELSFPHWCCELMVGDDPIIRCWGTSTEDAKGLASLWLSSNLDGWVDDGDSI